MKNILLIITSIIILNNSIADYMARVPLEIDQGGSLPNNSIIIGNSNNNNNNNLENTGSDPDGCYFQKDNGNYVYWVELSWQQDYAQFYYWGSLENLVRPEHNVSKQFQTSISLSPTDIGNPYVDGWGTFTPLSKTHTVFNNNEVTLNLKKGKYIDSIFQGTNAQGVEYYTYRYELCLE